MADDSQEYLEHWAELFANAVSQQELKDAAESYRRISGTAADPADREIARQREKALRKHVLKQR